MVAAQVELFPYAATMGADSTVPPGTGKSPSSDGTMAMSRRTSLITLLKAVSIHRACVSCRNIVSISIIVTTLTVEGWLMPAPQEVR